MALWIKLMITLCIGITGGVLAKKAKIIPAAYMLGALFFTVIFNLSTGMAYYPIKLRIVTQIIAGTYLGMKIERQDLGSIKTMGPAIGIIMSMYAIVAFAFGYILYAFCDVELLTALYCFAPGGISDLGIIADGLGCDVGMITFMQLVRLITVFTFYPFLYQYFEKAHIIHTKRNEHQDQQGEKVLGKKERLSMEEKTKGLMVTLLCTLSAGLLGYYLNVPAGPMVFAMIVAIIVNITYKNAYLPMVLRFGAQIMSGIYLGLKVSWETVYTIFRSPIPVLLMISSVVIFPVMFGFLLHKITKHELSTCLFACTPGGMTEMTLLADDMGLDIVKISVTHVARMVITIMIFPHLFNAFIALVNYLS